MDWKKYTVITPHEALDSLQSSLAGLDEKEAERRILEYGKNNVQDTERFFIKIIRKRSQSPLTWIFLVASLATFFFGNYIEAVCILAFLLVNATLEFYQEFHSEKASRLLRHFVMPRARIWRNGEQQEIASQWLVPGDIIHLEKGDTLPADVRFLTGTHLTTKEIHISSDRQKIEKQIESLSNIPLSITEANNIGFAGTCLTQGRGEALVIATGASTALGAIAFQSSQSDKETSFERNITHFSRFLVKLLLFGLLVVFLLYFLIHGEQVQTGDMIIFTLVLAITVVPEALPALTTLILARGSVKLTKKNIVVKRLSAIEDLGSIEVLCIDKAEVLTENKLTVASINGQKEKALYYALLASHTKPTKLEDLTDVFDKALWQIAGQKIQAEAQKVQRVSTVDFDIETRLHSVIVKENKENLCILRGAPEEIFRRIENADSFTRSHFQEWIREAGFRGERVLAVAFKKIDANNRGFQDEGGFSFLGLIAFLDPIKPEAKKSVELAKKLGVQVKIFSGDSKEVVGAVGYAVGLIVERNDVITGTEFEALSLPEQIVTLEDYSVFARFSPTQKSAALQLLQKSHRVGFLGNGSMESDALQIANVALVSQDAGDIAREASDILLLQKDLGTVLQGILESRKIFANILKYIKITLASNFGNFYSITLAALFLPYLPLLPLQILFLNFLSDMPMLAIAGDRVDYEKLERPKDQNIHALIVTATIFGMISSFFDLTIFRIFSEYSPGIVQTTWFLFSVVTEVLLLYSLRSRRWFFKAERPSSTLMVFSILALLVAVSIPYITLGTFLGFEKLSPEIYGFILILALGYFLVTEIIKRWYYMHSALFSSRKNL